MLKIITDFLNSKEVFFDKYLDKLTEMELTKTKLNKILERYREKLEEHEEEWKELCKKVMKRTDLGDGKFQMTIPSIYDHERHNSKGAQLFKDLMAEFEGYEVFPKKQN